MVGSLLALLVAVASPAFAPSLASGLACAGPEAAPLRASLAIDTSSLREAGAGPAVARQLRVRADTALQRATIVPCGGALDPVVAITVAPMGDDIGYESSLVLQRRGQAIPGARLDLRCVLCTEGELVLQLAGAVEGLVPQLRGLFDGIP